MTRIFDISGATWHAKECERHQWKKQVLDRHDHSCCVVSIRNFYQDSAVLELITRLSALHFNSSHVVFTRRLHQLMPVDRQCIAAVSMNDAERYMCHVPLLLLLLLVLRHHSITLQPGDYQRQPPEVCCCQLSIRLWIEIRCKNHQQIDRTEQVHKRTPVLRQCII